MASALDGITVLDLTNGPAGALATMLLSDHGARVIRVVDSNERATRRGGYLVWDRGKECIRLDLSRIGSSPQPERSQTATGQKALEDSTVQYERLIRGADVLVEDFSPASGRQNLVNDDKLTALNPRLIHCSITAYGKTGPLKDEPAIDDLVMARSGILTTQPGYRPGPVHLVHRLPSVGAALLADQGIVAALLARERTGLGRTVSTSLLGGALMHHPKAVGERLVQTPFQSFPAGSAPFYSVYECADGECIQLGCVHQGFINIAAGVLGIRQVIEDPKYGGGLWPKTPEVDQEARVMIAQVIRTKPYQEWKRILEEADVPSARVCSAEDGIDDPQVKANGMVVELQDPEVGLMAQMGVPIALSVTPGKVKGPRTLICREADGPTAGVSDAPSSFKGSHAPVGPWDPPLKGFRVLEICNLVAGPTAGRLLADLGADVIKLEPLEGDMARSIGRTYFFSQNMNKRSISVNIRTPEGKDILQKIAATADVLLANLRPHATERMGIGLQFNPRLIETHLTGFGWSGPYAERPGIDPLAQALIGLSRAQGGQGNAPVGYTQLAPTDYAAGGMGTLGAILALFARERTGVAQRADTNLLNGGIILSSEWFTRYQGKPQQPLADKGQNGLDTFHRLYEASDGWIYVAADTPEERRAFCEVLDCENLPRESSDEPAACHPADTPLAHALAQRFAGLRLDECLARLKAAGVSCAPAVAGDNETFLSDPQAIANDMVGKYRHLIVGQMRVAQHYVQFGNTSVLHGRPSPVCGENTREILQDVGFTDSAIAELYAKGVVRTQEADAAGIQTR